MRHVISLGAGVQSSAMALMAAKGEIGPMPDFAMFADTQAEPQNVYDWLDWLEQELPFPVHRVTKGNLTEESLRIRTRQKDGKWGKAGEPYVKSIIPVFGQKSNGELTAALGRSCTEDYKILPLRRKLKEERRWDEVYSQWIGISYDEIQRMKQSRVDWVEHRFPLIELEMHRHHCLEWMKANGYPEPPRSACYYCPFHSDEEWRNLRNNQPEFFKKAIEFDRELRVAHTKYNRGQEMEVYLHRSCIPLGEIDFDNDEDKGQLTWDFKAECEGMCGV